MHTAAKIAGFKPKSHRFPGDRTLQTRWFNTIKSFRTKRCYPRRSRALCSLHFKPSNFFRKGLIDGSIPTSFSPPRTAYQSMLNRKRAYARCCVPGCQKTTHFNLYQFVAEHDTADSGLARERYQAWVRTLQVAPCLTRPEVWVCGRHFVNGFPAGLSDRKNVDWVPTLHLEGIPRNPCRQCSVMLQKLPDDVLEGSPGGDGVTNLDAPFCRLCLEQNGPLQSMFLDSSAGQRLAELIEKFGAIKIDLKQDSSGSVCIECLEKLAVMEEMEQVRARWIANNDMLQRIRGNNNDPEPEQEDTSFKEDPEDQEVGSHPVVSIPMATLIDSMLEPPKEESLPFAYDDFKEELEQHHPANISQDCIIVEPPKSEVIDLTDIDERERLIRQAMRSLRRQLKPSKRKRKRSKTSDQQPSHRKPCRNTRIG